MIRQNCYRNDIETRKSVIEMTLNLAKSGKAEITFAI